MTNFYQIYYKESQLPELYPFSTPYFNEGLTPFFENSIISELVLKSQADKIAVCSWALKRKRTAVIPPKRELTAEVLEEDFDVMSFTKNSTGHDMLTALEEWHSGSTVVLKMIWSELGLTMPRKPKFPIYQNHFCATKEVYKAYVLEFLMPAMHLMEYDPEIKDLLYQNTNYTRTILNQPIDSERMMKYLGVPYVPLHPFLLERCFSLWIDNKNLNVVYL